MVQSGLIENISVSHYRLSIHLLLAFIILSSLIWLYINYKKSENKNFFNLKKNFISIKILFFFIFLQIIIGAFVSGLDAGKIYQTWPLMNGSYFPNDIIALRAIDYFDLVRGIQTGDASRAYPEETTFFKALLDRKKIMNRF